MNYIHMSRYRPLSVPEDVELSEILSDTSSLNPTSQHAEQYDKAESTRTLCIMGLVLTWIVGIACVIVDTGAVTKPTISDANKGGDDRFNPYHNWPQIALSPYVTKALTLLFDIAITFLIESTGLIHSTTLRWALKDRLSFNSNLRLFTSVKSCLCLSPISNAFHTLCIVVSYAAASALVFALQPSQEFCDSAANLGSEIQQGCGGHAVISTPAICCLGIAMLGLASLATWQISTVAVPTWSTNPLDTAWASISEGSRAHVSGRCMMSVHDSKLPSSPQQPKLKHRTIWSAHRETRRIMYYI